MRYFCNLIYKLHSFHPDGEHRALSTVEIVMFIESTYIVKDGAIKLYCRFEKIHGLLHTQRSTLLIGYGL